MNALRKLFAPKEAKAAFGILDELSLTFDFRAFEKIKGAIEKNLVSRSGEFVRLLRSEPSPRKCVFGAVANLAADLVESGDYHIYRGALNPMDDGENLLRLLDAALDELVHIGAMDASFASEQKEAVRKNIENVG